MHEGRPAAAPPEQTSWTREDDELLEMLLCAWTREDDKLLELLLPSGISLHDAADLVGRTPEQVCQRCDSLVDDVRRVLEALELETPREWDMQMHAAATTPVAAQPPPAVAAAEEEERREAGALVVPVAPEDDSAAPTVVGGGDRSEERRGRKKGKAKVAKKTAVKWTEEEHRAFLAGLDKYKGKWKEMSRVCVPTKSPIQIASHHQKYCIRAKQRERNECKRGSINDITEPAVAVAVAGADQAAAPAPEAELPSAPGQEDEPREPAAAESGEDGLGPGPVEELLGKEGPGTLPAYDDQEQWAWYTFL